MKVKTPKHIMVGKAFDCCIGPIEFDDEQQQFFSRVTIEKLKPARDCGGASSIKIANKTLQMFKTFSVISRG